MGGILGSERDHHFERDAHTHAHTPSTKVADGAGQYAGRQQYNSGGRYDDDDSYTEGSVTPPPRKNEKKRASWKIWR
jgi:hypothetical protein